MWISHGPFSQRGMSLQLGATVRFCFEAYPVVPGEAGIELVPCLKQVRALYLPL